jgi:nitronate monooxygenase
MFSFVILSIILAILVSIGVACAELAAETCRAGGLGFLAAGHFNSKEALHAVEKEIEIFKAISDGKYPLCIGFISHSTFGSQPGWDLFENLLENCEPDVVQFFAGSVLSPRGNMDAVKIAQSYGCKVIMQVCTVEEGKAAFGYGADAICAQGSEAGGHGIRRELGCGTLSLVAELVELSAKQKKPISILAAGGITNGKDLAAALTLGADGVVLGTRLWASTEAKGPQTFKDALVAAKSADDVVRTRAFDTISNSYNAIKWPVPYDSSGVLRNKLTKDWDDDDKLVKTLSSPEGTAIFTASQRATQTNNLDYACVYSGKGVGRIKSIEPAHDIIMRIEAEAVESIRQLEKVFPDTPKDV